MGRPLLRDAAVTAAVGSRPVQRTRAAVFPAAEASFVGSLRTGPAGRDRRLHNGAVPRKLQRPVHQHHV